MQEAPLTTQLPEQATTSTESTDPSRRQVLCGLAVALLAPAALAAACGDGGGTTSEYGAGTGATSGPTTGAGAGGGASAGGSALAKVSDVPVGGGVIVNSPQGMVLLVQPTAGTIKGYNPTCTHQGTTIGAPQSGVMTCPNHGSQFNAADGSVKKGPAARALATIAVKVDGANVVLA
jgi:cytochrome b6-f complex iron-sulfur subunit